MLQVDLSLRVLDWTDDESHGAAPRCLLVRHSHHGPLRAVVQHGEVRDHPSRFLPAPRGLRALEAIGDNGLERVRRPGDGGVEIGVTVFHHDFGGAAAA